MKKSLYLGFCLVLAMGVGCAITDYELITDNDQVHNGQGSGVINTKGKAHIMAGQVAFEYPDGTDELFSMVDQTAAGDRTLTTYNNFSTGDDPIFHDNLYCNTAWQGCSMITADDPEIGDVDIFDFSFNVNCSGIRSLVYVLSTTRYYGECGRAKIGLADRANLIFQGRMGTFNGREVLYYDLTRNNFSISLDNNSGVVTNVPITGTATLAADWSARRQYVLDLTDPLIARTGMRFADFQRSYGTHHTTMTLTYNGIAIPFEISSSAEMVNSFMKAKGM
jgi:hypothetical protein